MSEWQINHNISIAQMSLIHITDLDSKQVFKIFELADSDIGDVLLNELIINLSFENSTRTSLSFQIAAKKIGAHFIDFNVNSSSLKKGESLQDTVLTLAQYDPKFIIIRHFESGILNQLDGLVSCNLINAGDGTNEHPTQALIDAYTIQKAKGCIKGLIVSIVGDVLHSRVAHSNMRLLSMLGAKIRLVGPPTLLPKYTDFPTFTSIEDGLRDADVVMTLRMQMERIKKTFCISEYKKFYRLGEKELRFAKREAIVLHPGPVNREFEITTQVIESSQSLISRQVKNSIPIRCATFAFLRIN